jgi:putative flippase GtrA
MLVEFGTYLLVGVCAAVGHYGTLIVLTEAFNFDPVHASIIGFFIAGAISYVLNYRFTFRSTRRHVEALPIFGFVVAVAFVINWVSMVCLNRILDLHYIPSQLITTGIMLIWQYSANKLWTFRAAPSSRG